MTLHHLRLLAFTSVLVALGAIAACSSQPSPPLACTPSASSSPSGAGQGSAAPTSPFSATGFRDDFADAKLDPDSWQAFAQFGLISFANGHLQLTSSGLTSNYPYLFTKKPIVPSDGAYFFEVKYAMNTSGASGIAMVLDYAPPSKPDAAAVATPFMIFKTQVAPQAPTFTFTTETGPLTLQVPAGSLAAPGDFNQVRIEDDAQNHYRVIVNRTEVAKFSSAMRPAKFWLGSSPLSDKGPLSTWPWITLDHVAAGPLTAIDPATPPSPSPIASQSTVPAAP